MPYLSQDVERFVQTGLRDLVAGVITRIGTTIRSYAGFKTFSPAVHIEVTPHDGSEKEIILLTVGNLKSYVPTADGDNPVGFRIPEFIGLAEGKAIPSAEDLAKCWGNGFMWIGGAVKEGSSAEMTKNSNWSYFLDHLKNEMKCTVMDGASTVDPLLGLDAVFERKVNPNITKTDMKDSKSKEKKEDKDDKKKGDDAIKVWVVTEIVQMPDPNRAKAMNMAAANGMPVSSSAVSGQSASSSVDTALLDRIFQAITDSLGDDPTVVPTVKSKVLPKFPDPKEKGAVLRVLDDTGWLSSLDSRRPLAVVYSPSDNTLLKLDMGS